MFDTVEQSEPVLIQGGMGVAVSDWRLAKSVSLTGQLGVVSGTAIDTVLIRRLQLGDVGGHVRRALAEFPYPKMVRPILDRYFVDGGIDDETPFATTMVLPHNPTQAELELVVVANFVEVYLAKENHDGVVGVNYLEKVQTPTLPSLFGAMLAGVDYVLMGAGIPRAIPGILDRLQDGIEVELPLHVLGTDRNDEFVSRFDPRAFGEGDVPWLHRPKFLAIVASATLATVLARKSSGRVDGFIVEGPTAGGHNAPPRGKSELNDRNEPTYGKRDTVDLGVIKSLGLPFWLAGSYGTPEKLCEAIELDATGVQVGTAFAFCEESGFDPDIKHQVIQQCIRGELDIVTDALASPTGFPFKVLHIEGSMSDDAVFAKRQRVCDLGFLRQGYRKTDGTIGWRCPGEPVRTHVHKGGEESETIGRKCVCNGLLASIAMEQRRSGGRTEQPLVTCGSDVASITQFLAADQATTYHAADVVECLLSGLRVANEIG